MTTILYILAAVGGAWGLIIMIPGIRLRHWGPIVAGLSLFLGCSAAAVTGSWLLLIAAFLITRLITYLGSKALVVPSLHEAAGAGRKAVVEYLIAEDADVNAKDAVGHTPLHWAADGGHKDVAAYLIAKGADVNAKGIDTPLHGAARRGHTAVVEYLIAEGADVNAKDAGRYTPLHGAAVWGHKDVVVLLIAKGADVNAEDHNGLTPLHLAAKEGHKDVMELLKKHGARKFAEQPDSMKQLRITAINELLREGVIANLASDEAAITSAIEGRVATLKQKFGMDKEPAERAAGSEE